MSYLSARIKAVTDERKFFIDLVQYLAWWMVNGRRTKGMEIIKVENIDPVLFMQHLRNQKTIDTSARTMTSEERKKIIAKLDAMHAKEQAAKTKS